MSARDPAGYQLTTTGESGYSLSGPLGTVLSLVVFSLVAGGVIGVVTLLETAARAVLPSWLVLPTLLVGATVVAGGGLWAVLRFNEWRRHR